MKISTLYDKHSDERSLLNDIKTIRDALNGIQSIMELDGRTSDPSGFPTTTAKVYLWFRTDTNELKAYVNGATKAVTLT